MSPKMIPGAISPSHLEKYDLRRVLIHNNGTDDLCFIEERQHLHREKTYPVFFDITWAPLGTTGLTSMAHQANTMFQSGRISSTRSLTYLYQWLRSSLRRCNINFATFAAAMDCYLDTASNRNTGKEVVTREWWSFHVGLR